MAYGQTYSSHSFASHLVGLFVHQLQACKLARGEVCVCITESDWNPAYAAACQSAATQLGAEAIQVVLPSDCDIPQKGFPALCAAADLIVYMCSFTLHYHVEIGRVLQRGGRVMCCMQPPRTLRRLKADPVVRRRALQGASRLDRGDIVRITSEAGTDLVLSTREMPALAHYGVADEPGHLDFWCLGSVESAVREGTTNGKLVLDVGDCCFHLGRFIEHPVTVFFESDRIVAIEGGLDARLIRTELEAAGDKEAFRAGHIAWGVDHRAKWLQPIYQTPDIGGGGADNESFFGTVQVELGSNDDVAFKGTNRSRAHLGLCLRNASLSIDDQPYIVREIFVSDEDFGRPIP